MDINKILEHKIIDNDLGFKFRNKNFFFFYPIIILLIFFSLLLSLFKFKIPNRKTIGVFFTQNQKEVFSNLGLKIHGVNLNKKNFLKSFFIHSHSFYSVYCYKQLLCANKTSVFRQNWIRLLSSVSIVSFIDKLVPKDGLIVVFNDHSIQNLAIIDWANENKRKTMYIQHSPVTNRFPKLKCNYNFLFSQSAYDCYKIAGTDFSKINYYIGCDLRLMKFRNIEKKHHSDTILICTNELDEMEQVNFYLNTLKNKGYKITIRLHPLDTRDWKKLNYTISNNNLVKDFEDNKYILVNETALFLEAAVADKLVYKCSFSPFTDHYGFLKKGFITNQYTDVDFLCEDLKNNIITYDKNLVNYYSGFLNNSSKHTNYLNNIISNHE